VNSTAGFSCEIRPQSFHKRTREIDLVTPVSQTVQTI
jgi:hypothetical protein